MTPETMPERPCHFTLPRLLAMLATLLLTGCAQPLATTAWVIRYDLENRTEVDTICATAKELHLDHLLVQVRGRGDAFYQSRLAPSPEPPATIAPGFDPLAATIAACKPLPIHAWLNVYYLWGDESPSASTLHPANGDPETLLHDNNGRSVADYDATERALGWIEGIYADPASTTYRDLFTRVVAELVDRYPVAGIHLDFVRYPGLRYGQTSPIAERFRARWGLDPRLLPEHLLAPDLRAWLAGEMPPGDRILATAALLWAEQRAEAVTALVSQVRHELEATGRDLPLSAAVLSDPGRAFLNHGQDWPTWIGQGLIDAVYPMAYFGPEERVGSQLRDVTLALAPGSKTQVWAGLGAYIKEPSEIGTEAETARDLGVDGIALFSLGHLLQKPAGPLPYLDAIRARAGHKQPRPRLL